MNFAISVMVLAVITAVACAIPGVFVVLRKNSMLVDAIGHAVLPGIVIGYFFARDLNSPWLILGAALSGLLVVLGNEYLARTRLISGDAPQGLIFPALFSVGVIMVTLNFGSVHLDTHAVLVGDLNLAAFDPTYTTLMLAVLVFNVLFAVVCYRPLRISTFDPEFADTIGVRSRLVNTAFMFTVSLTVTAAFNAAGAILVIALVVIPAATAYLLTDRLPVMFVLTALIAAVGAILGFWLAYALNAATSAGMSVFYGVIFAIVLVTTRLARNRRIRSRRAATPKSNPLPDDREPYQSFSRYQR
ncbi:MAG: metal ABC transporter permease [Gulosibacter sp.]|uniref:metal ABC transporter permease n=1 Tax=Gulosibacter sp. TaxID=2817531 RepID=UPI003F90EE76